MACRQHIPIEWKFWALNLFKLPLFLRNHNRNRAPSPPPPPSAHSARAIFIANVCVFFQVFCGCAHAGACKLFQFIYNKAQHEVSRTDEKHNQLESDLVSFRRRCRRRRRRHKTRFTISQRTWEDFTPFFPFHRNICWRRRPPSAKVSLYVWHWRQHDKVNAQRRITIT